MANTRKLPPDNMLLKWDDLGLTYVEIAAKARKLTGDGVTPQAVGQALKRAGADRRVPRYPDEVPWQVYPRHTNERAVRMLRMLGRRHNKKKPAVKALTEDEGKELDKWLEWLEANNAVVAYCDAFKPGRSGFYYVLREETVDGGPDTPVRDRLLKENELPD